MVDSNNCKVLDCRNLTMVIILRNGLINLFIILLNLTIKLKIYRVNFKKFSL